MTTANELGFGVEIECFIPVTAWAGRRVQSYHGYRGDAKAYVTDVPGTDGRWYSMEDSSLHGSRRDVQYIAVEIISPVLRGVDGLEQLKAMVKWIRESGGYVNSSTGLHITIDFTDDAKSLKRLIHLVARNEKALYAMTGTKSRERGSYAIPIAQKWSIDVGREKNAAKAKAKVTRRVSKFDNLNLSKVSGYRPLIEFRTFAGTLNEDKMLATVQICLGIIVKAITGKSTVGYVANTAPHAKGKGKGAGHIALLRLLKTIGWFDVLKSVTRLGAIESTETVTKRVKSVLIMADKYDAAM